MYGLIYSIPKYNVNSSCIDSITSIYDVPLDEHPRRTVQRDATSGRKWRMFSVDCAIQNVDASGRHQTTTWCNFSTLS